MATSTYAKSDVFCQCEKWHDISGWEDIYQISNFLRIKSRQREIKWIDGRIRIIPDRILAINYSDRYPAVSLWKNNKGFSTRIHTIVASVFIPNPFNKSHINHINGDKQDFSIQNLEWVTPSENSQHAVKMGLFGSYDKRGENNPKAKLTAENVRYIREMIKDGAKRVELAKTFNVDTSTISDIVRKRSWSNI